jgi:hypothetical protein
MTPRGLIQSSPSAGSLSLCAESDKQGEAKTEALSAESTFGDADLAAIVQAWPDLPAAVRAGIGAMVKAATPSK